MAGKKGCGGKPGRSGRPVEWTQEDIEALAADLMAWFEADPDNCFYKSYFGERDTFRGHRLYPELISTFQPVNDVFSQTVKRIELLQQNRLIKKGFKTPIMSIFCLKANHGWKDTHYVESTSRVIHEKSKEQLAKLTEEQLKDRLRSLTTSDN